MSKIYQFIESNGMDIKALDKIDNDLMDEVVGTYVECYIWGRILNDLEYCLEKNSDDIERTLQIEDEMKSYVSNVVDVASHSRGIRENKKKILFVSHYGGGKGTKEYQDALIRGMKELKQYLESVNV